MEGLSHTKDWLFGYKLHLVPSKYCSIIVVPLAADFITANIHDNQMYSTVTCSLPVTITRETYYMSADPDYDDHKLYNLSRDMGFQLLYPA